MKLNTRQALELLADDDQNYIHHYSLGKSTLHDGSGDELGTISRTVFSRLLRHDKIKYFAESPSLHSDGYFNYKEGRMKKI